MLRLAVFTWRFQELDTNLQINHSVLSWILLYSIVPGMSKVCVVSHLPATSGP